MSEVLSDKKEHKYVTTGFFLPISELWAVVELQRKIIYIHLSLYLNKTTRVDVVGYKGSSLNTKDVWKTLFSVWESNYTHLNVNASFFPDTKPRIAAVCKISAECELTNCSPFFPGPSTFLSRELPQDFFQSLKCFSYILLNVLKGQRTQTKSQ